MNPLPSRGFTWNIKSYFLWFFTWILCLAEDSLETSSLTFSEKQWKKYLWMLFAAVVIGAFRVNKIIGLKTTKKCVWFSLFSLMIFFSWGQGIKIAPRSKSCTILNSHAFFNPLLPLPHPSCLPLSHLGETTAMFPPLTWKWVVQNGIIAITTALKLSEKPSA